jgi:hypothetical protein
MILANRRQRANRPDRTDRPLFGVTTALVLPSEVWWCLTYTPSRVVGGLACAVICAAAVIDLANGWFDQ